MQNAKTSQQMNPVYTHSLYNYKRIKTIEVRIGNVPVGGDNPIRIQSMTTTDTMDTEATVQQTLRMVESGAEYVRITAPSRKEAENLAEIRSRLHDLGYKVPLIADIHYTPNAAEIAARLIEKVRVNPGNYVDKKKFDIIEYTDEQYNAELDRIHERFAPLVKICKEEGAAMRIGTNHGSLSDRIMSRYGDTPLGMVESAMEFLRICERYDYDQVVLSMKASNPQVMVQAYRLLVSKMMTGGKVYPLHLGVTEAGEGEDGRIKSAVGIGALLLDGIGDTIRVSLTEEPEYESPVARFIVGQFAHGSSAGTEVKGPESQLNPYAFKRIETRKVANAGDGQVPIVIGDLSSATLKIDDLNEVGYAYDPISDKYAFQEIAADYIYLGDKPSALDLPGALVPVYNFQTWRLLKEKESAIPYYMSPEEFVAADETHSEVNFVEVGDIEALKSIIPAKFSHTVLILPAEGALAAHKWRRMINALLEKGITQPVVLKTSTPDAFDFYEDNELPEHLRLSKAAKTQLFHAGQFGSMVVDGLIDGIWIERTNKTVLETAFGILQASRLRITKTEYISCPSCGRTLFDLQETTARIRERTEHLKGVKIGIMGCIVNGPGEMADADYGYVGIGPDKIALYRGQQVVERAIKTEFAVDKLIDLIKEDGNWTEPNVH